jgi:hypothetical protein
MGLPCVLVSRRLGLVGPLRGGGRAPTRRAACCEGRFRDSCDAVRVPFKTLNALSCLI